MNDEEKAGAEAHATGDEAEATATTGEENEETSENGSDEGSESGDGEGSGEESGSEEQSLAARRGRGVSTSSLPLATSSARRR